MSELFAVPLYFLQPFVHEVHFQGKLSLSGRGGGRMIDECIIIDLTVKIYSFSKGEAGSLHGHTRWVLLAVYGKEELLCYTQF